MSSLAQVTKILETTKNVKKLTEGFDLCTENNKIEIIENDTEV